MKKSFAACAVLALAAALAGCASPAPDSKGAASPAPSTSQVTVTPTPTPTPTAMTAEAAGKYYIDHVCPSNKAGDTMNKAFAAQPLDVQAARSSAAAYRDSLASGARDMSAPPLAWPPTVKPDVDSLVQADYKNISSADYVAGQTTLTGLISAWNAWNDSGGGGSAQAIRVKLGLSSDAKGSCGLS